MAMRLGMRSAKRTKKRVTPTKGTAEATCLFRAGPRISGSRLRIAGDKRESPTMPARMATAFSPIWTVVKNSPG